MGNGIHSKNEELQQPDKHPLLKRIFNKKIFILLLLIVILSVLFNAFYLKKVAIYEPITISLSGLTYSEQRTITVCCTTPLNRKTDINYSNSEMLWKSYYSFISTIELIIPDSLSEKIKGIEVFISDMKFNVGLQSFQSATIDNNSHSYHLPGWIKSEKSYLKMIESMFYWHYMQLSLKILLVIAVSLLMIIRKLRRWFFSVLLFLPLKSYKIVSKTVDWILSKKTYLKWIIIFLVSLFIAFSLFFGYIFFKYVLVTFASSIIFILWVGLFIWLIIRTITKIFKMSRAFTKGILVILIIFLFLWICIESFLRIIDIGSTYNEKIGLYYSSGFIEHSVDDKESKGLWVYSKYYERIYKKKEFSDAIKCNAVGLRDNDHPIKKDTGEYRIICLGNSFTEGIGAPQDSAWPKQLERRLKLKTKRKVTVFNAGMSGSDPFFEYMLLQKKMLNYNPDLVLVALGSSDFGFYRFRGGFERFTPDGYKFRKAPCWEGLYALSYVFRFVINNVFMYENLQSPAEQNADRIKATKDIEDCINRFVRLSEERKFTLKIVFIDDGNFKYFPLIFKLTKQNTIPIFNMFEYNNKIEKLSLSDRYKYYWTIDGHCNSNGYALMAKGVEWYLNKIGIVDSLKLGK